MRIKTLSVALLFSFSAAAAAQKTDKDFLADLKSGSLELKLAAVDNFRAKRSPEGDAVLSKQYKNEKDAYVRKQIAEGLDVNRSTYAYECARAALKDPSLQVRQSAVEALARYGDVSKIEADFKELLGPAAPRELRLAAINALGFNASTRAVALLDSVAADTVNPSEMRRLAVISMGRMGGAYAKGRIKRYANDKDAAVKAEAKKTGAGKKAR